MPGKVKVKIASGRNLPVMDRSSDTTDAYVEIKLGNTTYKTDVCRKSLHPQWNSEWYKFEVDDAELQDEPLQIRLMDHDTYSANDAIGKVYIDLNPLLLPAESMLIKYNWNGETSTNRESSANSVMSGWFPVYDTMHGIRGEVNVTVKVELFIDSNRFRQSSCGVRFFCSKAVPHGYLVHAIYGFVEELVVDDDPEYQWIDKIRTPRASNEARQTLFFKLSGELQRKIGLKALDLGGNAVIGYNQSFDLEGESGIVARGIGTVVTLIRLKEQPPRVNIDGASEEQCLNYLKFLGYNNSFRLNSPPQIPKYLAPYFPSLNLQMQQSTFTSFVIPQSASYKRKQFTRHLSHTDFGKRINESIEAVPPIQHSSSLQTLLKQEDNRGVPGHGISQRLKNFKYSSHSLLSGKMRAFKAKLSDASNDESCGVRTLSIPELVEQKKKKPFKFMRASSDSSVMAELLVRSVMTSNNSLESILEVHDNSPPDQSIDETSAIQKRESFLSKKTISEPLLTIPQSSVDTRSIQSTSSDSTSSEEDENFDSQETHMECDTVSNIVKNVQIIERKLSMRTSNISKELPFIKNNKFCLAAGNINEDAETGSIDVEDSEEQGVGEKEAIVEAEDQDVIEEQPVEIDKPASVDKEVEKKELEDNNTLKTPQKALSLKRSHFAEAENFSIDHSDEEVNFFLSDPEDDNIEEPLSLEKEQLPLPPDNKKTDSKLIIPPVMIGADIESKSLVTTAMQTMLLEKVNIMGSYTPPMSPASSDKQRRVFNLSPPESVRSSPSTTGKEESFLPHITKTFETVRRSPTSLSLAEMGTTKETCGAPFTSLSNIRCNTPIDSKPSIVEEQHLEQSDTNIDTQLTRARSVGLLPHKKFNFFRFGKTRQTTAEMGRRKSHEPVVTTDDTKTSKTSFKNKMFSFRQRKGLLDTALKNVAMETVQDILATSHVKKSSPFASSAVLNSTNTVKPTIPNIQSTSSPTNIEIDKGTSVSNINMHASLTPDLRPAGSPVAASHQRTESVGTKMSFSPAKMPTIPPMHRRSSDSDLSITPKGNSLTGSDRSAGGSAGFCLKTSNMLRAALHQDNFDLLEYPFLTMLRYPPAFIMHLGPIHKRHMEQILNKKGHSPIKEYAYATTDFLTAITERPLLSGGAVSSRSVKLLERITNLEKPESRDTWWSELRLEIRSHARALNCNAVLGYTETTSICEDVCVLSASGTAAVVSLQYADLGDNLPSIHRPTKEIASSFDEKEKIAEKSELGLPESPENEASSNSVNNQPGCTICHLPYSVANGPLRVNCNKCTMCKRGKVPDILIATIDIPEGIPIVGHGCFLQANVCRPLKDLKSESNAKEISDGLPFLEYELHRILVTKLRIKGMNSVFGLKVRISIGEKMMVGSVTGTAVFLAPLSTPAVPKLVTDPSIDEKKRSALQKHLLDTIKTNKEIYQIKTEEINNGRTACDNEDSEEEQNVSDLSIGSKDCCVLEVEDPEDLELINLLQEARPPDGFHVVSTEFVPGLEDMEIVKNLQMFIQIWRAKVQVPYNLYKHFERLLQSVFFKLRRMIPCALCNLQFRVDLPEPDEIQLCVLGMALGLRDAPKPSKQKKRQNAKRNEEELIFNLEDCHLSESANTSPVSNQLSAHGSKHRPKSPQKSRFNSSKQSHVPYRERHGVDITPLSYVPGAKIEKYLGNLNFFFIRETTSIREEGGLSGFVHSFTTEVLAIVRAHVTALGGNAMVAYFMTECVLNHNLHKNQGQCLINVGGDVVFVSYLNEEQ